MKKSTKILVAVCGVGFVMGLILGTDGIGKLLIAFSVAILLGKFLDHCFNTVGDPLNWPG